MRSFLKGMGLGAGLMYFFDRDQGRRRRALCRDQVNHAIHTTQCFMDKATRDLNNRLMGAASELRGMAEGEVPTDQQLAERVRAKLGRYVSHPGAVEVSADQGRVVLSGQVLAHEVPGLLSAVSIVRGVEDVENRLEPHERAENIASLQGGRPPVGEPSRLRPNTPASRLLATTAGLGLMGYCLARRSFGSMVLGTAGFGLLVRGASAAGPGRWMGGGEPLELSKSYEIGAPVERVWDFMADFDNYPRFMPGVRSIRELGDNRLRWTVALPTGREVEVDEVLTESVPNQRLSWRSADGAPVQYWGTALLHATGDGRSRVDLHLHYRPPGGQLGEALAEMFRLDPKSQIDEAFTRIKTHLEQQPSTSAEPPQTTPEPRLEATPEPRIESETQRQP